MTDIPPKEALHKVKTAIGATRRLGGKPSVVLIRYHKALFYLKHWKMKQKTAAIKVKKYRAIVKRYAKRLEM